MARVLDCSALTTRQITDSVFDALRLLRQQATLVG